MKRNIGITAVLMALMLVLASCVGSTIPSSSSAPESAAPASSAAPSQSAPASSGGAAPEYVLKLGYGNTTTNPRHLTAEKFAAWVSEQTDGRVQIDLYPSEMLGTDRQMAEQLTMGTLDMTINSQGPIATYDDKLFLIGLPFLFSSTEQAGKVLDGEVGEALAADLPSKGLRILAYWDNGLRQITNNVRPIEAPSDLEGLKIRAPEDEMTMAIMNALGAKASPLAFTELYMALSQGAFDGQENPITNIHANNFWEVQKYISIVNYKYECCPFAVSESVWNKLPEDIQKVLKEGAVQFATVHRDMVRSNEAKLLEELAQNGMTVSTPDTQPFKDATASVYDAWRSRVGEDIVNQLLDAANAAA